MPLGSYTPSLLATAALMLLAAPALARGGAGGHGGHGGGGGGGAHGIGGHVGGGVHVGGVVLGSGGAYVAPSTFGTGASESLHLPRELEESPGFGPFGGVFGGYLYVGPDSVWTGEAHWGKGFWASDDSGWAWYPGTFWVSPAYPGWVWLGPPWVWDGEQMVTREGYWTTAGLPLNEPAPSFIDQPHE